MSTGPDRPRGGRRWLPRSLFGRLMAVLVLGLVAAQAVGLWISLAERDQLMLRAAGLQPAQRVADLVLLLDPMDDGERQRIVRVLNAPPLMVRLLPQPEPWPAPAESAPAPPPGALAHLALYRAALRTALGDERPAQVQWLPPHPGRAVALAERAANPRGGGRGDERMRHVGMVFGAQVALQGGQWLRVDSRLPPSEASLPMRLLGSLAVLLLAVLALSWWAVRRVTQPLRHLAEAADALGRDLHRPPLPDDGPEEVQRANRAFNTMQTRLARYIEDRTRMLAAMSHDLKTPLTRMRLRAEMLDDDALRERFEHDLDEMSQMVSDTLEFMRGVDAPAERRPVDVMAVLESLQADQEAMGRTVTLQGRSDAPWTGDAARLRRCVGNLVDNAVLYGGQADVQVEDGPTALHIRVRDAGPGIPAAQLEQVFEPFFRLEASRNRVTGGSGLGLGIARNIARQAGGDVTLRNRPEGGLEACVTLPR